MLWMEEGVHYKRQEETETGGPFKDYTFVRFVTTLNNFKFEYNISPHAKIRGEEEIQRRAGDREAILALHKAVNEAIFKDMTKNPILYEIQIQATSVHRHSFPFYPVKSRYTMIGVSREIPKGKMLLMLNPEDFQVLEDHNDD